MKWVDMGNGCMKATGKKGTYFIIENHTDKDLYMLQAPEGDAFFRTSYEAEQTAEEWDE